MERVRTAEVCAQRRRSACGWRVGCIPGGAWARSASWWCATAAASLQAVAESDAEVQALIDAPAALETVVAVEGTGGAPQAQAPGGVELHELKVEILSLVTEAPPLALHKRSCGPACPCCWTTRWWPTDTPPGGRCSRLGAAVMAGFRQHVERAGFTEIQTPKLVASATEGGANVFPSTTSGGPRTSPRARSSTSRSWWGCSSGCSRWDRCSGPSPTTPPATSTNTSAWTSSWGSSATTST